MARIWIIDDDPGFLEMLRDTLEDLGHALRAFASGDEAAAYLADPKAEIPELILLDVMMPGLDGHALHQLLHADPRTRTVPVIIMTAKDWTRPVFTPSLNVIAFIPKPFDMGLLREAVSMALDRS